MWARENLLAAVAMLRDLGAVTITTDVFDCDVTDDDPGITIYVHSRTPDRRRHRLTGTLDAAVPLGGHQRPATTARESRHWRKKPQKTVGQPVTPRPRADRIPA
jgi:hypothetical protein